MSQYYRGRRKRNLYDPNSSAAFKLSRSRIELFIQCPRCFYIDRRLGLDRPPGFPFALNSAVDSLLKNEFDHHRAAGTQHPIQIENKLKQVPARRQELDKWRQNFTGVQSLHKPTNLLVFGAIDDLWIDESGNYAVVDYKATAKKDPIVALDKPWHSSYKRQMEIYQWLLRSNGLAVSDSGYFVYCNGNALADTFENQLQFDVTLIEYRGSDSWVEPTLLDIHKCLASSSPPNPCPDCDYCIYSGALEKLASISRSGPTNVAL